MSHNRQQPLSLEEQVLLACARLELGPEHRQRLEQLLAADLDWDRLVRCAVRQGIPTLLYHHLRSMDGIAVVPPRMWTTLEQAYRVAGLLAMRQRFEAGRLLDAFYHANVDTIILKGLALRGTVYLDPALRPSGDIDLLVHPSDTHTAEAILQGLGYKPDEGVHARDWYRPGVFHHLAPYRLPGREVQVEIHWDLAPPETGLQIDTEGLWRRAIASTVTGRRAQQLAPGDMMLHLSLHASALSRFLTGLRHLVDVAEATQYYGGQVDWEEVAVRAASWRVQHYAYLTMRVTRDLLGVEALDTATGALRPARFDERLVVAAKQRVVDLDYSEMPEIVTENLARYLLAGSVGKKLRLLPHILFPSRERMAHLYQVPPESKKVLGCYMLRPFQLLGRHTKLLLELTRGTESAVALAESRKADVLLEKWLQPAMQ